MKKYTIEFIGSFFLVFVVALTGNPVAIGLALTALVYMGGYISGANYNPAVTLALLLTKKITRYDAWRYILSQIAGGIAAAGIYSIIKHELFIPQPGQNVSFLAALLVEALFTFLLASVVLHVAATEKTKGNDYFGIAIGFTLLAAAFAGGPISGGAFNPAVGASPILFDIFHISQHFNELVLYIVGPLLGGLFAAIAYGKVK